jgi:hypothetical protein
MTLLAMLGFAVAGLGPGTRLGLAINVPEGGGEEEFLAAARQQIRMGIDGAAVSVKWDEFESQNGKPLDEGLGIMKLIGQEGMITIASLDTVKRRLPPDIMEKAWDDPSVLERWTKFLAGIVPKLGKQVRWISLGNEVDGYLASRPSEVESYLRFLASGRTAIKKLRPDMQVGVTVMCADGQKNPSFIRRLQEGMDVAAFTYYPNASTSSGDLASVAKDFDFMIGIAGARQLLLQEIGYPASEAAGGSPERQAQFVRSVFASIDRHEAKIPLAVYFLQCDFGPGLIGVLEQYYGLSHPSFIAFLSSLGLMDSKGKPRPAWRVFQQEVAKRKPL